MAKDQFRDALISSAETLVVQITMATAALKVGDIDAATFMDALSEALESLVPERDTTEVTDPPGDPAASSQAGA